MRLDNQSAFTSAAPRVTQDIQFFRACDGIRIAASRMGKGPPLVLAAQPFSHLEINARNPISAPWLRELSRNHSCVCYDHRGFGLSDRSPPTFSFDSWVSDLAVVTNALDLERFALFGMGHGGPAAIAYAARFPERVSHLVLFGTYALGKLRQPHQTRQCEEAQLILDLIRLGSEKGNKAFRQLFSAMLMPDGTVEQHCWFKELERLSSTPKNITALMEVAYQLDVSALAEQIQAPTLIFHGRNDAHVSFEEGRNLAALIPSARLVPLDTSNHMLLNTEPAWQQFVWELRDFLATPDTGSGQASPLIQSAGLTQSELEVLRLMAKGLDNRTIAVDLSKSEKTVRNQISAIFSKLNVSTRAAAIVLACEAGIVRPAISPC
jgi:pimeloyl-ACP methyl ester carboxylesterase/DNA-binding CsgD family transcriptional regulator